MQEIIEEVIRVIGYLSLKLVTFGRYAGGSSGDRLLEGAFGLALIALGTYLTLRFSGVG
jgi:hypothetical protein